MCFFIRLQIPEMQRNIPLASIGDVRVTVYNTNEQFAIQYFNRCTNSERDCACDHEYEHKNEQDDDDGDG